MKSITEKKGIILVKVETTSSAIYPYSLSSHLLFSLWNRNLRVNKFRYNFSLASFDLHAMGRHWQYIFAGQSFRETQKRNGATDKRNYTPNVLRYMIVVFHRFVSFDFPIDSDSAFIWSKFSCNAALHRVKFNTQRIQISMATSMMDSRSMQHIVIVIHVFELCVNQ